MTCKVFFIFCNISNCALCRFSFFKIKKKCWRLLPVFVPIAFTSYSYTINFCSYILSNLFLQSIYSKFSIQFVLFSPKRMSCFKAIVVITRRAHCLGKISKEFLTRRFNHCMVILCTFSFPRLMYSPYKAVCQIPKLILRTY